jgi:hypothetical protein
VLEKLHSPLMFLRSGLAVERAQVASPAGGWIFFARIKSIFPTGKFANHRKSSCIRIATGPGKRFVQSLRHCSRFGPQILLEFLSFGRLQSKSAKAAAGPSAAASERGKPIRLRQYWGIL